MPSLPVDHHTANHKLPGSLGNNSIRLRTNGPFHPIDKACKGDRTDNLFPVDRS